MNREEQLEAQVEALRARLDEAETALKITGRERDQAIEERRIAAAAAAGGSLPEAIEDVVGRVIRTPELAKLPHDVAVAEVRKRAPYFFAASGDQAEPANGATSPSGGGFAIPARNPWSREHWHDTEQALVYRADPAKAEAMAKAAGSRIGALKPE